MLYEVITADSGLDRPRQPVALVPEHLDTTVADGRESERELEQRRFAGTVLAEHAIDQRRRRRYGHTYLRMRR